MRLQLRAAAAAKCFCGEKEADSTYGGGRGLGERATSCYYGEQISVLFVELSVIKGRSNSLPFELNGNCAPDCSLGRMTT